DPENNPTLRHMIERAKRDQVPSHVIDKAIEKARGVGGEDFVLVRYEGFGPGGSMVIVDCLTDNNNRSITDVRNCFTRTGSKLGPTGSVAHMFDHLAVLSFAGDDPDRVLEAMLEADVDVDDVESDNGMITLFAPASEFFKAKTALLEAFPDVELQTQEVTFLAQTDKELTGDDAAAFEKLMNLLNDCDDVQDIYHNAILPA
ncbi:MAG: YebC/PmpR family DNA-binding transcriptional regulator, partial [Planctomycetaceae bacterium]|nr:YebC/PmpR family DNA-binding transcriptional regulator [Planctomycetaceae bacterium]